MVLLQILVLKKVIQWSASGHEIVFNFIHKPCSLYHVSGNSKYVSELGNFISCRCKIINTVVFYIVEHLVYKKKILKSDKPRIQSEIFFCLDLMFFIYDHDQSLMKLSKVVSGGCLLLEQCFNEFISDTKFNSYYWNIYIVLWTCS